MIIVLNLLLPLDGAVPSEAVITTVDGTEIPAISSMEELPSERWEVKHEGENVKHGGKLKEWSILLRMAVSLFRRDVALLANHHFNYLRHWRISSTSKIHHMRFVGYL